mmetsp:Transcript_43137/g.41472  ORF Transcript_43137/g.41472 Transcript_43137/m.41472 type:complete len:248 (+) Transcript_43137:48-791(+)
MLSDSTYNIQDERDSFLSSTKEESLSEEVVTNGISVDDAFEYCGGFGRFNKFFSFAMVLALSTSQMFLYSFVFLELYQQYECYNTSTNAWDDCDREDFCDDDSVQWQIDWSSEISLHNLIEQFDFYCASDFLIGLLGACFLIGIAIGCVTLARLADVYGRRKIFIFSMVLFLGNLLTFLVMQNEVLVYFVIVVVGWAGWGKQVSGYTHLLEMNPKKNQVFVSTLEFFMEGCVFLFACIYFYWISTYW